MNKQFFLYGFEMLGTLVSLFSVLTSSSVEQNIEVDTQMSLPGFELQEELF